MQETSNRTTQREDTKGRVTRVKESNLLIWVLMFELSSAQVRRGSIICFELCPTWTVNIRFALLSIAVRVFVRWPCGHCRFKMMIGGQVVGEWISKITRPAKQALNRNWSENTDKTRAFWQKLKHQNTSLNGNAPNLTPESNIENAKRYAWRIDEICCFSSYHHQLLSSRTFPTGTLNVAWEFAVGSFGLYRHIHGISGQRAILSNSPCWLWLKPVNKTTKVFGREEGDMSFISLTTKHGSRRCPLQRIL